MRYPVLIFSFLLVLPWDSAAHKSYAADSRDEINATTSSAHKVYHDIQSVGDADELDLSGEWKLFLPAGFERNVTITKRKPGGYHVDPGFLVTSGNYHIKDSSFVSNNIIDLEPDDEAFIWRIRSPHMMVLEKQIGSTGSDYTSAILFRRSVKDVLKQRALQKHADWEYRVVPIDHEQNVDPSLKSLAVQTALNKYSEEGWELSEMSDELLIFKRRHSVRSLTD